MKMKICIDPGHGGIDSGAKDDKIYEKDVVFSVALLLQKELEETCDVILTRYGDYGLPAKHNDCPTIDRPARCLITNGFGADILISLHCNASNNGAVSGTETFYWKNSEKGYRLAQNVHKNIVECLKLKDRGIKSDIDWKKARGYSRGPFILEQSRMPAIIVELGFITCREDREMLVLTSIQKLLAEAISRGIQHFMIEDGK